MPLHIVRNDITKINCDAIVNAANNSLLGGGGVDGAIHAAAGEGLLAECKTLGGCNTGDAKVTKGYNLPCNYVIHTVGPIWSGGNSGERELLVSCYVKSLQLALQHNCETVAFPLISSGAFGYPKEQALQVAVETIKSFLLKHELTVYLVVFDKGSYQISQDLFEDVSEYIDDNYASSAQKRREKRCEKAYQSMSLMRFEDACLSDEFDVVHCSIAPSLTDMLANLDDSFAVTLLKLIDIKGIKDVECYKRANVSRQTWYKILNERDYKPSKNTVLCFAIALKLSLEETKSLLKTVGFALSKSSKFDVIIEYFLINKIYDIFTINETLFEFDQVCLGV